LGASILTLGDGNLQTPSIFVCVLFLSKKVVPARNLGIVLGGVMEVWGVLAGQWPSALTAVIGNAVGAVIQGVVVILLLATHRATERAVRCVRSFIAKSAQGGRSVMPFALFAVNCHYYEYVLTSGHHLVSSI
jgi:hypothetical protein